MSGGDDAFDRAVRALRETGETTSAADVARTRSRILQTMHRGERRGRRAFWVVLPIAAVLAGSTALAKNSEVGRRVWTRVAETIGLETPAENAPVARAPRGVGPSAEMAPGVPSAAPIEPGAPSLAAPAPERAATAPRTVTRENANGETAPSRARSRTESAPRASAPPPVNTPPAPTAAEQPEAPQNAVHDDGEAATLALYKHAYRLHFVEQNYADALAGWDAYLRSAPTGRLVVEARYNRAIALVRLGRRSDAEAALGPFARGEVSGGYRAREARELLDALNASSR